MPSVAAPARRQRPTATASYRNDNYPDPTAPVGALIGKVGPTARRSASARRRSRSRCRHRAALMLGVNDNEIGDNSGAFIGGGHEAVGQEGSGSGGKGRGRRAEFALLLASRFQPCPPFPPLQPFPSLQPSVVSRLLSASSSSVRLDDEPLRRVADELERDSR